MSCFNIYLITERLLDDAIVRQFHQNTGLISSHSTSWERVTPSSRQTVRPHSVQVLDPWKMVLCWVYHVLGAQLVPVPNDKATSIETINISVN